MKNMMTSCGAQRKSRPEEGTRINERVPEERRKSSYRDTVLGLSQDTLIEEGNNEEDGDISTLASTLIEERDSEEDDDISDDDVVDEEENARAS